VKKSRALLILLSVILVFTFAISCDGDDDSDDDSPYEVQLRISPEGGKYWVGEEIDISVEYDQSEIPQDPYWVWTVESENGEEIGEYHRWIRENTIDTGHYFDMDDYSFDSEGEFIVTIKLFNEFEFENLGTAAAHLYGMATATFSVQNIRLTIEYSKADTDAVRVYDFKAEVENPEYLRGGAAVFDYVWHFDDGSEPEFGGAEVIHQFQTEGEYNISVGLMDPGTHNAIATAETTLVIGLEEGNIGGLTITPDEIIWETKYGLSFKGVIEDDLGEFPSRVIWEWDFGDDTEIVSSEGNSTYYNINHGYPTVGNYEVQLTVRDIETNAVLATATSSVTIDERPYVNKTNLVRVLVQVFMTDEYFASLDGVLTSRRTYERYGQIARGNNISWPLEWTTPNKFETRFEETLAEGQTRVWTISGEVSEDVSTVVSLTVTEEYNDPDYNGPGKYYHTYREYTLVNVPIEKMSGGDRPRYYVRIEGSGVQQYLSNYEYEATAIAEYGDDGDGITSFVGFDWGYQAQLPKLEIEFKMESW